MSRWLAALVSTPRGQEPISRARHYISRLSTVYVIVGQLLVRVEGAPGANGANRLGAMESDAGLLPEQPLRPSKDPGKIAVGRFRSPSNFANNDDCLLIEHGINDPILTLPEAIEVVHQLYCPLRSRVVAK